jgi:ABC-2 type transport system permease protein
MRPDVLAPEAATTEGPPHGKRPASGARVGEIARQTLRLQRRGLALWITGVVLLVGLYGSLWPSIKDQSSLTDLMDQMPEVLRSLLAAADMSTPVGYVQTELLGLTGPLLVIMFAVVTGANGIAGEEDRRSLELLLANPVTRTRVVLERIVAMLVGTAALVTAIGAALVVVGRPAGLDLPVGRIAAAMLHLGLLGAVFGTLAAAVGAATGRLTLARAVPAVAAVLAYLVNGLAPLVDRLEPFRELSPFAQYSGHTPLAHGVSVAAAAVSAGTVLVLTASAAATFRRRDVAS